MIKLKDLIEDITIPVKVGDTILVGKFKNKKMVIKDIGTDKHGMPTINGRKATTFRIHKRVNIFDEESVNEKRIKNSPLRRMITSTFKDLDKKFRKKLTKYDIDSVISYIKSKNRYFPEPLANIAGEYFYEYKRGKLKINHAIQATINYQRGYPYKHNFRTGNELESKNEAIPKLPRINMGFGEAQNYAKMMIKKSNDIIKHTRAGNMGKSQKIIKDMEEIVKQLKRVLGK